MKETIIFDLDGTLVDSKELHDQSFEWACRQQVDDFIMPCDLQGMTTIDKGQVLNNNHGFNFDLERLHLDKQIHTDKHVNLLHWNPGIPDLFNSLHTKYNIVIASNARSHFVYDVINRMNLYKVDIVLTKSFIPDDKSKPDPFIFNFAMKLVGADPSTTTIIEDSEPGFIAATRSEASNVIRVSNSDECYNYMETLF